MRLLQQICLVLLELIVEAILLGVLFGVMISGPGERFLATMGGVVVVAVGLGILGKYYISRLLALVVRKHNRRWHYPALAVNAFLAHGGLLAVASWRSMTVRAHAITLPYLIAGAFLVFLNAEIGNRLFFRWAWNASPSRP